MLSVSVEERREALFANYREWPITSLGAHYRYTAEKYGERPFMMTEEVSYTYQEVWYYARSYAKSLLGQGVRPGDHVAILMSNRPENLFLMIGIWSIGAVCIPINTMLRENELRYIVQQSDAQWLFMEQKAGGVMHADSISNMYEEIKADGNEGEMKRMICIQNTEQLMDERFVNWDTFFREIDKTSEQELEKAMKEADSPDQIANIMYTSGSTGTPKGVIITHDMFLRSGYSSAVSRAYEDGRRVFSPLPFYHIFVPAEGIIGLTFVGGALIVVDHFSPLTTLEIMAKHKASDFFCVPAMLVSILNQPEVDQYNLESLHFMLCAATPAPVSVWKRAVETLGIQGISTGYGSTEVVGAAVHTEEGDAVETIATRVGRPKPANPSGIPAFDYYNLQMKTVDPDTGEDLPKDSVGELAVRGNFITYGYYKMPNETAKVMGEDRWFRTGDVFRIDDHHYLELLGRSKEMYKVSGENVAPKEVEDVISQHEAVSQAHVVGVSDAITTETGAAFVELRPGSECSRKALLNYCKAHLARFKVPRYIWFITDSELPIGGNGKVQKMTLAERAENELARKRGNK